MGRKAPFHVDKTDAKEVLCGKKGNGRLEVAGQNPRRFVKRRKRGRPVLIGSSQGGRKPSLCERRGGRYKSGERRLYRGGKRKKESFCLQPKHRPLDSMRRWKASLNSESFSEGKGLEKRHCDREKGSPKDSWTSLKPFPAEEIIFGCARAL